MLSFLLPTQRSLSKTFVPYNRNPDCTAAVREDVRSWKMCSSAIWSSTSLQSTLLADWCGWLEVVSYHSTLVAFPCRAYS